MIFIKEISYRSSRVISAPFVTCSATKWHEYIANGNSDECNTLNQGTSAFQIFNGGVFLDKSLWLFSFHTDISDKCQTFGIVNFFTQGVTLIVNNIKILYYW